MNNQMVAILGTMLVAGALGGCVNYLLSKPDDLPPPRLFRSLVVGIAAALLMPLFLNMISSNLIDLVREGNYFKLFELLGFGLIAAISSTAFIRTLSDRVLSEARQATKAAKEAKAEVAQVQNAIEPIVAKETEMEPIIVKQAGPAITGQLQLLSDEQKKVLNSLATGQWTLRSQSGLAKELGLERRQVTDVLSSLSERGLVATRHTGEGGVRWYSTEKGRSTNASSTNAS
jgi:DNA-binding MarR family transcriptional regulator